MTTTIRTYSQLRRYDTIEERFRYLSLKGLVGDETFGADRYINQLFYTSRQWRDIRHHVLLRDGGCDLGIEGFQIHSRANIHHMNPMTVEHIRDGDSSILDPEVLITCSDLTHKAIHYGDESILPHNPVERKAGDTNLWGTVRR